MPILGQYINQTFPDGWCEVSVSKYELKTFSTGNKGVVFQLTSEAGAVCYLRFPFLEKMYWKIGSFVQACGLEDEQLEQFDTDEKTHLASLVGRQLQVQSEAQEGWSSPDIVAYERSQLRQPEYELPSPTDDDPSF